MYFGFNKLRRLKSVIFARFVLCFVLANFAMSCIAWADAVTIAVPTLTGDDLTVLQEAAKDNATVAVADKSLTLNLVDSRKVSSAEKKDLQEFFDNVYTSNTVSSRTMSDISKGMNNKLGSAFASIALLTTGMTADVGGGMQVVQPLMRPIQLILGIGAWALVVFVALTTIIDLIYISFPMFRTKTKGESGDKPVFISAEAEFAVSSTALGGSTGNKTYRNPMLVYGFKRGGTYIILGVVMVLLISGQINNISLWVVSLVSGLMDWIGAM